MKTIQRNFSLIPAMVMTAVAGPVHEAFGQQEESLAEAMALQNTSEAHDRPLTDAELAEIFAKNRAIFAPYEPGASTKALPVGLASFVVKAG